MNNQALRSLADFIERRQDIDFYYPDIRSCVLGFAIRQLRLERDIGPASVTRAQTHLGVTAGQATAMFAEPVTADGRTLIHSDISRKNAVRMLRRAAETGSIFFDEPTRGDRDMGDDCGCPVCRERARRQQNREPVPPVVFYSVGDRLDVLNWEPELMPAEVSKEPAET